MNIEQSRLNMIEQQLRTCDVNDSIVLELLKRVKRENFVPKAYQNLAFSDLRIPLLKNESMLTPREEAFIVQSLSVQKNENILEIGTGSGYLTALLAHLSRYVTTLEIHIELVNFAQDNLNKANIKNVKVIHQNGFEGYASAAPYDIICISGSLPFIPEQLFKQLNVGGRLFAFVGEKPLIEATLIHRTNEHQTEKKILFETTIKALENIPTPSDFSF